MDDVHGERDRHWGRRSLRRTRFRREMRTQPLFAGAPSLIGGREDLNPAGGRSARAWARKDASPPRSGRDELTSGLGDREVAKRPGSARRAAVADVHESCSNDAPSNGNPDPLPPGSVGCSPRNDTTRTAGRSVALVWARDHIREFPTSPTSPNLTFRCARGPRRRHRSEPEFGRTEVPRQ